LVSFASTRDFSMIRSGNGAAATPHSSHRLQARFSRRVTNANYFAGSTSSCSQHMKGFGRKIDTRRRAQTKHRLQPLQQGQQSSQRFLIEAASHSHATEIGQQQPSARRQAQPRSQTSPRLQSMRL
jgi:hypothetical protein